MRDCWFLYSHASFRLFGCFVYVYTSFFFLIYLHLLKKYQISQSKKMLSSRVNSCVQMCITPPSKMSEYLYNYSTQLSLPLHLPIYSSPHPYLLYSPSPLPLTIPPPPLPLSLVATRPNISLTLLNASLSLTYTQYLLKSCTLSIIIGKNLISKF